MGDTNANARCKPAFIATHYTCLILFTPLPGSHGLNENLLGAYVISWLRYFLYDDIKLYFLRGRGVMIGGRGVNHKVSRYLYCVSHICGCHGYLFEVIVVQLTHGFLW